MKYFIKIACLTFFLFSGTDVALAYIDPGTGSVIFGAIGYIIAAGLAFGATVIAFVRKPFMIFYKRLFKKSEDEIAKNIDSNDDIIKEDKGV